MPHPLDALAALASDPVDLLIADLLDAVDRWQGGDPLGKKGRDGLNIFLVSGYDRGAEIAQETGARFFRKPVDLDKLRAAVDEALQMAMGRTA